MKDGKVVCYLYGYPKNNGYGIFFESENASYMLNIKDDLKFRVDRNDSVVYSKFN
jgi:chromosome condensin MukBEF MukE localization factor